MGGGGSWCTESGWTLICTISIVKSIYMNRLHFLLVTMGSKIN
jgi:hypothetical protein